MFTEIVNSLSSMSKEDLKMLGFLPYNTKNGITIMLIPKMMLSLLPKGTKVISIDGNILTIGTNHIDATSVEGYILYGILPKKIENKISIDIGDVIQYTYFEAVPWYLNKIGCIKEIPRSSSYHFTAINSGYQGISSRAEYIENNPIQGLSYLLLFSAVSIIFHGGNKRVFEDVADYMEYNPVKGDWTDGEKFIVDELKCRMSTEDINRIKEKRNKKKVVVITTYSKF